VGDSKQFNFRIATQEDIDFVRENPYEPAVKGYPDMDIPTSNAFTAVLDGEVLGVFGMQLRWKGVGVLWLICADNFRKCGVRYALKTVSTNIDYLTKENNAFRVEAYVRTDFPKAIKMMEYLGFKREGLMKQFCPDKGDSYLYAKVI